MEMALSSSQFCPRLSPKLPALTRPSNSKYNYPSPNLEHSHTPRLRVSAIPSCFLYPSYTNVSARSSGPFLPPHGVAPSHQINPSDDGPQAIDTVHDLYSAIGSRNTGEFTHLIADDCKCTCNFTPLRGLHEGKEHVIGFLTTLIGSMEESMVMKVDTSCYGEGDTVGVLWHLGRVDGNSCSLWERLHIPHVREQGRQDPYKGHGDFHGILSKAGISSIEIDGIDDVHLRRMYASCNEIPEDGNNHMNVGGPYLLDKNLIRRLGSFVQFDLCYGPFMLGPTASSKPLIYMDNG